MQEAVEGTTLSGAEAQEYLIASKFLKTGTSTSSHLSLS